MTEFLEPLSANEAILQNMLGAENELREPESRIEELLLELLEQGGTGGEVTPASVANAISNMSGTQKEYTRENLDVSAIPTVETVSGTTASIAAAANTIYECGELSALTITSVPASGDFTVRFTSGSTPTTFTEPAGMVMPDGFTVEANKRYEINVSDGYAVVASWAVSA